MKTYELKRSTWLKDKANRIWRWNGSKGTYSGKWLKWQKARSWRSVQPFFEWWQTSIVQRMPKARWFTRNDKFITHYSVINLSSLEKDERITKDMEITKFKLKELGYIKKESDCVKVLWTWDFSKKLTFTWLEKFSKTATNKIEKAWAKIN
jgi:ribosomal protein L15